VGIRSTLSINLNNINNFLFGWRMHAFREKRKQEIQETQFD